MLIVLFLIGVGAAIAGTIYNAKVKYSDAGDAITIAGFVTAIIFGIALLICSIYVSLGWGVDDKIKMYEAENAKIDTQVCYIVENYKKYEKTTFNNVKTKDANTLVLLYPELKSDTLVKEQIKIYNQNRKEILNLKKEKMDYKPLRWWVYFGS